MQSQKDVKSISEKETIQIDFKSLDELINLLIYDEFDDELIKKLKEEIEEICKKVNLINDSCKKNTSDGVLLSQVTTLIELVSNSKSPLQMTVKNKWGSQGTLRTINGLIKQPIEKFHENLIKLMSKKNLPFRPENLNLDFQQNMLMRDEIKDHFNQALEEIKKEFEKDRDRKEIYICHGSVNQYATPYSYNKELNWIFPFITNLSLHLEGAGIGVTMFPAKGRDQHKSIIDLVKSISYSNRILVFGSSFLSEKSSENVLLCELTAIERRIDLDKVIGRGTDRVVPILIEGTHDLSFPVKFGSEKFAITDWAYQNTYFQNFCSLLDRISDINNNILKSIWDRFLNNISEEVRSQIAPGYKSAIIKPLPTSTTTNTSNFVTLPPPFDSDDESTYCGPPPSFGAEEVATTAVAASAASIIATPVFFVTTAVVPPSVETQERSVEIQCFLMELKNRANNFSDKNKKESLNKEIGIVEAAKSPYLQVEMLVNLYNKLKEKKSSKIKLFDGNCTHNVIKKWLVSHADVLKKYNCSVVLDKEEVLHFISKSEVLKDKSHFLSK